MVREQKRARRKCIQLKAIIDNEIQKNSFPSLSPLFVHSSRSTTPKMHLPVTLATLLLPTLALSSSQLYLSPPLSSSSSSSSSTSKPLTLTAPQANAVLAHHLGVSSYVDLPLSSSREQGREWEQLLSVPPSRSSKFVILLECPSDTTCLSLVPSQFTQSSSRAIELPNLGENSYLSALSLHLYRLADSLGLKPDDNVHVKGLKEVVEKGLKGVVGWQGWVGKELASWIGYDQVDNVGLSHSLSLCSRRILWTNH